MKSPSLIYLGLFLIIPNVFLLGQDKGTPVATEMATGSSPFSAGNYEFLPDFGVNYRNLTMMTPGQMDTKKNRTEFRFGADYFFVNNIGVGLEFSGNFSGIHDAGETLDRKWMGMLNLTYGLHICDQLNLFAKAGIGYGDHTQIMKSGSYNTTFHDKLFDFRFTVGAPISLQPGSEIYLTPQLSYNGQSTSFDGGKSWDNRFIFGLQFDTYIPHDQFTCGLNSKNLNNSWNRYEKGTSFFELADQGSFGINSLTTTYNGSSGGSEQKESTSCASLCVDYHYFFLKDLAIGVEGQIRDQVQKIEGSDNKDTKFDYMIGPNIRLNLPTENWTHNLFLQGGVGFGSSSQTSKNITSQETLKYNLTDFSFGLGYNHFITQRIPITTGFQYRVNQSKESGISGNTMTSGWGLKLGFGYYLK